MKLTFGCEKSSTETVNEQTPNKQYNQRDISNVENRNQNKGQRETELLGMLRTVTFEGVTFGQLQMKLH